MWSSLFPSKRNLSQYALYFGSDVHRNNWAITDLMFPFGCKILYPGEGWHMFPEYAHVYIVHLLHPFCMKTNLMKMDHKILRYELVYS